MSQVYEILTSLHKLLNLIILIETTFFTNGEEWFCSKKGGELVRKAKKNENVPTMMTQPIALTMTGAMWYLVVVAGGGATWKCIIAWWVIV